MKLKSLIVSIFLLLALPERSFAQADSIYTFAERMPEFPGGADSMYRFIYENINYPSYAREKGIQGVVVAQFLVDTFGNTTDIKIIKGIGGGCDEEVLRIMELMNQKKKWIPGFYHGKSVLVTFSLPITFRLEGRAKKSKSKKN